MHGGPEGSAGSLSQVEGACHGAQQSQHPARPAVELGIYLLSSEQRKRMSNWRSDQNLTLAEEAGGQEARQPSAMTDVISMGRTMSYF